ncbi:MAG: chemotaxis response regulator protein-glutamate methylesterase [Deltaproteobacteria bacterium]|nr:chemotaxis response regulator protein-glutamate methylesterase [Deltaproteobacteria bacterium]
MSSGTNTQALSVLVVDDSALYRKVLKEVVNDISGASFAGSAANGKLALDKLQRMPVDFVLLDLEMPEMNGIETLELISRDYPDMGVVMVSGTNQNAADITIEALDKGALDFVAKPDGASKEENKAQLVKQLTGIFRSFSIRRNLRKIRRMSGAPRHPVATEEPVRSRPAAPASAIAEKRPGHQIDVLVIGVSTGGPKALTRLVPLLPPDLRVPVLIVQHMPPLFTASLAKSLDKKSKLRVQEAEVGKLIEPGTVLIAPGGKHMVVRKNGNDADSFTVGLNENPPENSCRPAADVLFRSVAAMYRKNILAVVMTGMGEDGMRGVKTLKQRGCYCLTQDEETCVIYGMPKAVVEAGLSDESQPIDHLAGRITALVNN